MSPESSHKSVLEKEVVELLLPTSGNCILDATLGLGGHALSLISAAGQKGRLTGLDCDLENLERAKSRLAEHASQCQFLHANFRDLASLKLGNFDIILADLGVSSPHFDDPARGFSFRFDGPLDMRLDRDVGETAAGVIARMSEEELADVFYRYGEIRRSRVLAKAVKEKKPATTSALKEAAERVFRFRTASYLPQIFQALRIAVNDEMRSLEAFLRAAPHMLNPGGRLGIIAFHSLEDRMVKQAFRMLATVPVDDHGSPIAEPAFTLVTKKAVSASLGEERENPRSRSAKFRVVRRNI